MFDALRQVHADFSLEQGPGMTAITFFLEWNLLPIIGFPFEEPRKHIPTGLI